MHSTQKIFEYTQKRVCANRAVCQFLCSPLLFCFRELNRFLEISVRDPRKILRVSRNLKLDPRNLTLDPRKSKRETRASKLDFRFLKTLRIENRVSSRDCQLTFERYCKLTKIVFRQELAGKFFFKITHFPPPPPPQELNGRLLNKSLQFEVKSTQPGSKINVSIRSMASCLPLLWWNKKRKKHAP